jgi:hypothetical protein
MARAFRAAVLWCAAAMAMSWTPRSAAQGAAGAVSAGAGVAGVSVMVLGSAAGRGTARLIPFPQESIVFPQDQTGAVSIGPAQAVAPAQGLQSLDGPDWPVFSGMRPSSARRSPDRYALRPVYFDAQAFQTASDCLTAASLRRVPLEVCE